MRQHPTMDKMFHPRSLISDRRGPASDPGSKLGPQNRAGAFTENYPDGEISCLDPKSPSAR